MVEFAVSMPDFTLAEIAPTTPCLFESDPMSPLGVSGTSKVRKRLIPSASFSTQVIFMD